ncbi:DUF4358 domain-containing protein [Ruminococcus sp.]|uniref:DUF4358 domain-containing protein n=1 Tax=Ruminococcus sp. TaxID=41978 RepID=UPI0025D49BB6|nr:DUF4358 domain-containing protein [Ruminococcus sp.]MBQ8965916.1 DUF4358 domain-containing protein [Ruminococcus sp.]
MMTKIKALFIPLMMTLALAGCSSVNTAANSSSADPSAPATAHTLLDNVEDDLLDARFFLGNERFDNNTKALFGAELSSLSDGGTICNAEGGYADEVTVLKFKDDTDGQALLEQHLESRRNTFRDYRPDELAKLDKAKILEIDGFDVLIISDNADAIEAAMKG